MKNTNIIIAFIIAMVFSGCAGLFNQLEDVAVDRYYIPKQCPVYTHQFQIDGKKYSENMDVSTTSVVITLGDLTYTLETYKKAREEFNKGIEKSNETRVELDPNKDAFKRVEKRIFVDRECPQFNYIPEFKAKKLSEEFQADNNTTYVVISLKPFVFELEKSKDYRKTYNSEVSKLNIKN